jgi:hypothetical protein
MDRAIFFDGIRNLFGGKMTAKQVSGCTALLDEWYQTNRARAAKDDRLLAYMLATAFHETARTMQPIREYGRGKGKKYGVKDPATGHVYYGRGYVQLTWKFNYQKAKDEIGPDFVADPDLALDPAYAAKILFDGCMAGWFTGKALAAYINAERCDYANARRVVNGTDKAQLIAGYARTFERALTSAVAAAPVSPPPPDIPAPEKVRPHPDDWMDEVEAKNAADREPAFTASGPKDGSGWLILILSIGIPAVIIGAKVLGLF